ncbi:hypothetical protein CPB84DRAFT_781332 [Gymnopilus junonius]|uniref:Uncharacterized protein n=1 Tax=Gymnopilus junonius TaxID=109634 RepID=A0A9P5NSS4_GYMJU|nr:hypothetical protein CPB84DRAFT_781332 [Gymnopilus junonius]
MESTPRAEYKNKRTLLCSVTHHKLQWSTHRHNQLPMAIHAQAARSRPSANGTPYCRLPHLQPPHPHEALISTYLRRACGASRRLLASTTRFAARRDFSNSQFPTVREHNSFFPRHRLCFFIIRATTTVACCSPIANTSLPHANLFLHHHASSSSTNTPGPENLLQSF